MSWLRWSLDPYVEPAPRRVWMIDVVLVVLVVLYVLAYIGLIVWSSWHLRHLPLISAH